MPINSTCSPFATQLPHTSDKHLLGESIYDAIIDIASDLDSTITDFRWLRVPYAYDTRYDFPNFFVPVMTEYGLCFAFNSINSHEIYTDEYDVLKNNQF